MCFYVTKKRVKIAKEDLIVYKDLIGGYSPYEGYRYNKVEQPIVSLVVRESAFGDMFINEGYHFYRKPYKYEKVFGSYYEFIIPKGARYYENKYEIVAETCRKVRRLRKSEYVEEAI